MSQSVKEVQVRLTQMKLGGFIPKRPSFREVLVKQVVLALTRPLIEAQLREMPKTIQITRTL
jgi:hypothetical protein